MSIIARTTLLLCLSVSLSQSVSASGYRDVFEYVSPRPGAVHVSPGSKVTFRPSSTYIGNGARLASSMTVVGERSGVQVGRWLRAADGVTWIFEPSHSFADGERVVVSVGTDPPFEFEFRIWIQKPVDSWKDRLRYIMAEDDGWTEGTSSTRIGATSNRSTKSVQLPPEFPVIAINTVDSPAPGYIFVSDLTFSNIPPPVNYLMILDNTGFPVYFQQTTERAFDFKKQPNGLLTYFHGNFFHVMDSTYTPVDTIQAGNGYPQGADLHELIMLPNGNSLVMIYDAQIIDMSTVVVGGDSAATVIGLVIQEIDSSDNVVFQWRSWDHFKITDTTRDTLANLIDYAHGNAIEPDFDGHLLISSRHMDEITKINRQTGDIIWRLGGKNNEFTLAGDSLWFSNQHDIRRLANGNITLFDNGNTNTPQESRAVEYTLNESAKTATLVWQYRHAPAIYGFAMGNTQRLDNGNAIISWGSTNPNVTEVRPDGTMAFEMAFEPGIFTYRAFRFEWSGVAAVPTLWPDTTTTTVSLHVTKFGDPGVQKYYLYQGQTAGPTARADSTTANTFILHDSLTGIWYFRVTAVDSVLGESGFSNEIALDMDALTPVAITSFRGTAANDRIRLEWTIGVSDGLQGFNIYRSVSRSSGYTAINSELLEPAVREYTDASAEPGTTYWYKLGAVAVDGEYVSIAFRVTIAARFALHQNYPNPFNPRTTLSFYLPVEQWATLAIYDVAGRRVRTLVAGNMMAGPHTLEWDSLDDAGGGVASGVYFYRLTAGKRTLSRKLVILK